MQTDPNRPRDTDIMAYVTNLGYFYCTACAEQFGIDPSWSPIERCNSARFNFPCDQCGARQVDTRSQWDSNLGVWVWPEETTEP